MNITDKIYHDEESARLHLESMRWGNGMYCPCCGGTEKIKATPMKSRPSKTNPEVKDIHGYYYCGNCHKRFTVRTGTVYERSHIPLHKWVLATHLLCASTEKNRDLMLKNLPPDLFDVVSNPEFLREGVAVEDFMKPDREVIGTTSERPKKLMGDLYAPFVRQGNPVIYMDERSAELTKYAANSFLATKISFMNEIARLCEKLVADVDMVRRGIGSDDRIGKRFLFPGIRYGGSCFPKDVQALVKSSSEVNYEFEILNAVMKVNEQQKLHLIPAINNYFNNDLKGRHFALWALAFKPNTGDIREAPALYMIEELTKAGATVCAFDPEAMNNVRAMLGDKIEYGQSQ